MKELASSPDKINACGSLFSKILAVVACASHRSLIPKALCSRSPIIIQSKVAIVFTFLDTTEGTRDNDAKAHRPLRRTKRRPNKSLLHSHIRELCTYLKLSLF